MDYAAIVQSAVTMLGQLAAQGQEAKARKIYQASLDEFGKISLPKFETIVAQELGPSALAALRPDPSLVNAQNSALGQYDDIIDGDGFSAADAASMNAIGNQIARRASANRQGIQRSFDASGMGNSGAAVAAQMGNAQQANQGLNEAGLNTAAQGQANRHSAIAAKAGLAANMRSQNYAEQSRAAQAADDIARYNATARASAFQQNNANAQTQFNNAYNRQAGIAGAGNTLANAYNNQAGNTRQFFGNMGAAAYNGIKGAGSSEQPKQQTYDPYASWTNYGASGPDEWANPYGGY